MLKLIEAIVCVLLIGFAGYMGHGAYIGDYQNRSEMVALIFGTVSIGGISVYALFHCLFGDWLMKKMYGEFSNRNPWGR